MKKLFIAAFFFALLVFMLQVADAAVLSGYVKDDEGEGLPGAPVVIEGTKLGDLTRADGSYSIIGISEGSYTATASLIGYEKQSKKVSIQKDSRQKADFVLKQVAIQLPGQTVEAERPVLPRVGLPGTQPSATPTTVPFKGGSFVDYGYFSGLAEKAKSQAFISAGVTPAANKIEKAKLQKACRNDKDCSAGLWCFGGVCTSKDLCQESDGPGMTGNPELDGKHNDHFTKAVLIGLNGKKQEDACVCEYPAGQFTPDCEKLGKEFTHVVEYSCSEEKPVEYVACEGGCFDGQCIPSIEQTLEEVRKMFEPEIDTSNIKTTDVLCGFYTGESYTLGNVPTEIQGAAVQNNECEILLGYSEGYITRKVSRENVSREEAERAINGELKNKIFFLIQNKFKPLKVKQIHVYLTTDKELKSRNPAYYEGKTNTIFVDFDAEGFFLKPERVFYHEFVHAYQYKLGENYPVAEDVTITLSRKNVVIVDQTLHHMKNVAESKVFKDSWQFCWDSSYGMQSWPFNTSNTAPVYGVYRRHQCSDLLEYIAVLLEYIKYEPETVYKSLQGEYGNTEPYKKNLDLALKWGWITQEDYDSVVNYNKQGSLESCNPQERARKPTTGLAKTGEIGECKAVCKDSITLITQTSSGNLQEVKCPAGQVCEYDENGMGRCEDGVHSYCEDRKTLVTLRVRPDRVEREIKNCGEGEVCRNGVCIQEYSFRRRFRETEPESVLRYDYGLLGVYEYRDIAKEFSFQKIDHFRGDSGLQIIYRRFGFKILDAIEKELGKDYTKSIWSEYGGRSDRIQYDYLRGGAGTLGWRIEPILKDYLHLRGMLSLEMGEIYNAFYRITSEEINGYNPDKKEINEDVSKLVSLLKTINSNKKEGPISYNYYDGRNAKYKNIEAVEEPFISRSVLINPKKGVYLSAAYKTNADDKGNEYSFKLQLNYKKGVEGPYDDGGYEIDMELDPISTIDYKKGFINLPTIIKNPDKKDSEGINIERIALQEGVGIGGRSNGEYQKILYIDPKRYDADAALRIESFLLKKFLSELEKAK